MNTAEALLAALRAGGGVVRAEGDSLRYRGPAGLFSPATLAAMEEHKAALLHIIKDAEELIEHVNRLAVLGIGVTQIDHFVERAALMEFESGLSRDAAEEAAAAETLKLRRKSDSEGAR